MDRHKKSIYGVGYLSEQTAKINFKKILNPDLSPPLSDLHHRRGDHCLIAGGKW
jgi:hypothetical protein